MVLNKFTGNFSGFAKLDDLSKYSGNALIEIIKDMEVKVWYEDIYKYVLWENKQLAITICYHLTDEFMHIEREVWKDMDIDISHMHED